MQLFQFFLGSFKIIFKGGKAYYFWIAFLVLMLVWGVGGYINQLKEGLLITNMSDSV